MSLDANGRRVPRRLLMTAYGWNESGGGTILPRLVAKELVRRGWEVTVFHAGVPPTPSGRPYEVVQWEDEGVQLVGVHNRPHGLFDRGNPLRELNDPPISAAFSHVLDRVNPDVVHFHNLHNLGASLFDHTAARGLPAYFSTHNYWLICPRVYLMTGTGSICAGPGDGSACASCVGDHDDASYRERLSGIRTRAVRSLTRILAVSDAVRNTLLAAGYPDDLIDVVRQALPQDQAIWERTGRERRPGRAGDVLTVGFVGSAYPHKGPQLLVQAAQQTKLPVRVRIIGEVPARFAEHLRSLDRRGAVDFTGSFSAEDLPELLSSLDAAALPSMWWDCAPLAATECRAARTPLIVPRLGGLPEVVRDDVDGLVFDGLDADDLARQLDRLAGEPGLLERLQAAIPEPKRFAGYVDELEAYYAGEPPGLAAGSGLSRPKSSLAVRWHGDHGLPTSLSIVNDRITERLAGPVQRIGTDRSPVDPPLPHLADIEVRHQWPPDLRPPAAGRLATIVPWEFGSIPRDWLPQIERNVDELWVPSEYVRAMYIADGIDPKRVVSIPNGVDLDVFAPAEDSARPEQGLRFLFVGGLIWRKGPDVLLNAWRKAFAGRDDVTLVLKDFGADGVYRNSDRGTVRDYAASGALPRVELIEAELSIEELVDLYRSCDVLVHPYRGEGFAMPVLEAMACGLPVITTAGGPTDEFCPPEAGWRIRADRKVVEGRRIGHLETASDVWVLEPDEADLISLLRAAAAADPAERRRRGAAGRRAAQALSWDAVAARYQERIEALALRRGRLTGGDTQDPYPLEEDVEVRVLATPAWRGEDRLAELLADWQDATTPTTSACLYLVADPGIDGDPSALEARVLTAAAAGGVDLDGCADINVLMEPLRPERDRRLHIAMDAYAPLHGACAGHEREARAAGNAVIEPGTGGLAGLLAAAELSAARVS